MLGVVATICGAILGFMLGKFMSAARLEAQKEEYEKLYREYSRLTDRDSRGRFTKRK